MEVTFQLLDCDYVQLDNGPIIRLFGKTEDGKTVCAFYEGVFPHFYVSAKDNEELIKQLNKKYQNLLIKVEIVERYLPIGYSEKKEKLLKITIKDPSKIPEIRDFVKKLEYVNDVYESDILFKYRFMNDFEISGMKLIKAIGTQMRTNSVNTDITLNIEKLETLDRITSVSFKFLSIDIEVPTASGMPEPKKDGIGIISLAFYPSYRGKNTIVLICKPVRKFYEDMETFKSEKEMLKRFHQILEDFDPDIITGYNLQNFDLPYIDERFRIFKLPRNFGRCKRKSMIIHKLSENRFRSSIPGRIVADPYLIIREMSKRGFFIGLKRFGLGDVSKHLLSEEKEDISHSEIPLYWNGEESKIKKLIDYARKDAELALKILIEKNFLDVYIGVAQVSGLLLQDVLDGGEASKVENLLLRELNKEGFLMPCKPSEEEKEKRKRERDVEGLKGAFVFEPKIGLHTNCIVYLDFASMYPSFIIQMNICPTTLLKKEMNVEVNTTPYGTKFVSKNVRLGVIPKIMKILIEERARVKKQMKEENDPTIRRALDAKQEALKRVSNAFYGYTGYDKGRLYILDIANAITSCGREYIQSTRRLIEKETPYKVIYGDTDSLMVETNTKDIEEAFKIGEELAKFITERVGILKMKVECIFKTLLILAKKRYAGWGIEKYNNEYRDKIIMKGIETVRRDWCSLVGETLENILSIILKEQNPQKALAYFKEVIEKLQMGKIELEKLAIIKGISKRPEEYKGMQPHVELLKKMRKRGNVVGVGDRIPYIIVKGVELISYRAEDPEYVKEHNLQIDTKYYIENQILPPIERIFEAMSINKLELVGIGRQLSLSQIVNGAKINGVNTQLKDSLESYDGVVCENCGMTYRRPPLIGKCINCNGKLLFYLKDVRSERVEL